MRSKPLDTLRGIAILSVILFHVQRAHCGLLSQNQFILNFFGRMGWSGVDLFFVLSGFLVSGLLFKEYKKDGRIDLDRFVIRRALKIYPSYFICLTTTYALGCWFGDRPKGSELISAFFFLQNYFPIHYYWGQTWSLAVEEHFYLLLFLAVIIWKVWIASNKKPFAILNATAIFLCLFILGYRIVRSSFSSLTSAQYFYPSHARMDSLLFGVILSQVFHFRQDLLGVISKNSRILFPVALLLIAPCNFYNLESKFFQSIGFTSVYLGYGIILMCSLCATPWTRIFSSRYLAIVRYIGVYSYSIYLWHVPWIDFVMPLFNPLLGIKPYFYLVFSIYFIGSIFFGIVMGKIIEAPFLRLRDYYFPSRSGNV